MTSNFYSSTYIPQYSGLCTFAFFTDSLYSRNILMPEPDILLLYKKGDIVVLTSLIRTALGGSLLPRCPAYFRSELLCSEPTVVQLAGLKSYNSTLGYRRLISEIYRSNLIQTRRSIIIQLTKTHLFLS